MSLSNVILWDHVVYSYSECYMAHVGNDAMNTYMQISVSIPCF